MGKPLGRQHEHGWVSGVVDCRGRVLVLFLGVCVYVICVCVCVCVHVCVCVFCVCVCVCSCLFLGFFVSLIFACFFVCVCVHARWCGLVHICVSIPVPCVLPAHHDTANFTGLLLAFPPPRPFMHASVLLSFRPVASFLPPIHRCVCLFICPSVCLSVHSSINLFPPRPICGYWQ